MKKLFTLLLTLIMAICLINLNNIHIKADENEPAQLDNVRLYVVQGVLMQPFKQIEFTKDETMPSGYTDETSEIVNKEGPTYDVGKYFFNTTESKLIIANANGFTYDNALSSWGNSLFDSLQFLKTIEFNNCVRLSSNATYLTCLFSDCQELYAVDLSWMDTSNIVSMYQMFKNCVNLHHIIVSDKFVTTNVTAYDDMFTNCNMLVGGNGTEFDSGVDFKEYARIDKDGSPGFLSAVNGPIYCKGISYDTDNNCWKNGGDELNTSAKLALFGLTYDANSNDLPTLTITKSLSNNVTVPIGVLDISKSMNIKLGDNDITINSIGGNAINLSKGNLNVNFYGNNHKLTLKSDNYSALNAFTMGSNIYFKDIDIVATSSINTGPSIILGAQSINIDNSTFKVTNSSTNGYAFHTTCIPVLPSNYEILGKANLTDTSTKKVDIIGGAYRVGGVNAKYITIGPKKQNPSPSKKDESCEKVIGPTWHWNNTKGICEEVGVVGTFTR